MKSLLRRCILLCHVPCNNGHVGRHRLLPGIWENQLVWDCGSWSHRTNSTKKCSATINMFHVQTQQVIPSNNCNQHLSICLFEKMIFGTSSPFFEKGFCLQILAPLQCLYHRCSSKETPQMLTDILWSGGPWRVALPYSSLPEAEGPKRKQRIFKTNKALRAYI